MKCGRKSQWHLFDCLIQKYYAKQPNNEIENVFRFHEPILAEGLIRGKNLYCACSRSQRGTLTALSGFMDVRIISTPPGEAPEVVRKAWVGLVLPLAVSGAQTRQTTGVLTRPKTFLGLLLALLFGRTVKQIGYIVDAHRAVEILAKHAPDAAKWWRENAAAAITPGKRFLFAADACQELS